MWNYEKKLQYPVNIKNPNPAFAKIIMDQYGGLCGKKIWKTKNTCRQINAIDRCFIIKQFQKTNNYF